MPTSALISTTVEGAINTLLAMDPEVRDRLAALHGRVIAIDIEGIGLSLYLVPGPAGVRVLGSHEGEADCRIQGPPLALMGLGKSDKAPDQLFSGQVQILGDTDLARRFGRIVSGLDIDWEEQVSRIIGDVAAHELGNLVRSGLGWGRQARTRLNEDAREYLQEEVGLLPTRIEIEEYLAAVDEVRDGVERLEQRVARLEASRGGPGRVAG